MFLPFWLASAVHRSPSNPHLPLAGLPCRAVLRHTNRTPPGGGWTRRSCPLPQEGAWCDLTSTLLLWNQAGSSWDCTASLNVFTVCTRFLAPKAWLCSPDGDVLSTWAGCWRFGSEHLLPAGTFRKEPGPCCSCVFQRAWSRHAYSNLSCKLTDLCLLTSGFFATWNNPLATSQEISYTLRTPNTLKPRLMVSRIALGGLFTTAGSFFQKM